MAGEFFLPKPVEPKGLATAANASELLDKTKGFTIPYGETYNTGKEFQGPPMAEPSTEDIMKDVGKTIAARGAQGALTSTPGLAGDIGLMKDQYNKMMIDKMKQNQYGSTGQTDGREVDIGRARMGQEADERLASAKEKLPPSYGISSMFPTSETLKGYLGKIAPFTEYKPQTELGQKVNRPAEVGASLIGGGGVLKNIGRAIGVGGSSFLGQEIAENVEPDSMLGQYKDYIQPAFEIGGMYAGPKVGNILAPGMKAEEEVASAVAKDRARREADPEAAANRADAKTAMTSEEVEEAMRLGTPIAGVDIGGVSTRRLLGEAAGASPSAREAVDVYEAATPSYAGPARKRAIETAQRLSGRKESVSDLAASNAAAWKAQADELYGAAMTNPNANAIVIPPQLAESKVFQNAVDDVAKNLEDTKNRFGYKDKDVIPPSAEMSPVPPTIVKDPFTGEQRLVAGTGSSGVPLTNGNLAFYDLVKKRMYEMGRDAYKTDYGAGQSIDFARKDLTAHLENSVPEYKLAKNTFAENLGYQTAHDAGYDLGRRAGNMPKDTDADLIRSFANASDEQKSLLRHSYMGGIIEQLGQPSGLKKIATNFIGETNFTQTARQILGKDAFDDFRGKILSENFRALAPPIPRVPPTGMGARMGQGAGFGAALSVLAPAYDAITSALMSSQFVSSLQNYGGTLATGAGLGAIKGALDATQARRIATEIAPLLLDPNNAKRVSQLVDKDPTFAALMSAMFKMQPIIRQVNEGAPEEGQASGGRINRATGGRTAKDPMKNAASLIALANKIKNEQSQDTSSLLNLDDATVAKALAVANKHI
jgi:hypothetical protein